MSRSTIPSSASSCFKEKPPLVHVGSTLTERNACCARVLCQKRRVHSHSFCTRCRLGRKGTLCHTILHVLLTSCKPLTCSVLGVRVAWLIFIPGRVLPNACSRNLGFRHCRCLHRFDDLRSSPLQSIGRIFRRANAAVALHPERRVLLFLHLDSCGASRIG